jgi:hypothetical protein
MKKVLLLALLATMIGSVSAQCDPEFGKLVINEFMARNVVFPDEFGEFDDWVEIMNTTDEPINMSGYFLSDKHGNRTRYAFPNTTIEPGGYLLIWCDGQPWQGEFHADFKLQGSVGERVVLVAPDTTIIDHFDFGPVSNTHSLSRWPNGHGPFRYAEPSPNADNNETDYQPLVINEFLARNNDHSYDEFGNDFAWIELYNNRDIPLNLGGYFLSDKSNNPTKYQFPEPTILASGGYMVVYAAGVAGLSPFHASYGLSGSGEYVHLYNKDTVTLDFIRFGQQEQNISKGRFENGLGAFRCLEPTKGETNDPGTVNVTEYFSPDDVLFTIYPVPATDFINIQLNDMGNGVIEVFSAMGTQVARYDYQGDGPHYIDISDYARGVYLVRIGNNTKRIVVR